MRVRPLTPDELAEIERLRAAARATLARIRAGWAPGEAALAEAPFLDEWDERPHPQDGKPCLTGSCYGHPRLGDAWICTSPVLHRGAGWALTASRLYILGRPRPDRVIAGRRGRGRSLLDGLPSVPPTGGPGIPGADDDLPEP
ncbi:MAG: hypothetical protein MIN69_00455 [Methylorubrum extorquens]|jgi:hypothetical protein|uniref:DUF6634 family protein n=1 Tax=Methylorubrum extorquens TaxID=408 RepID=UPI002FEE4122